MDAPGKCAIVRTTGRTAYKLEATEQLAIRGNA